MPIEEEIRAYEAKRSELEGQYAGKFVLFHNGQLIGIFDDFDSAGNMALRQFGDNPSLIRKIGESTQEHVSFSIIRSQ
jgi:hypothetical protein